MITNSDSEIPSETYDSNGDFWQTQMIDEPEEVNYALLGISTDIEAWRLANKLGLMLDENGIIYGFDGKSSSNDI